MIIEDLAKQYANSIHGYKLVKYFEAASPVYKMELNFTLQKIKELTALQEFILKFIQASVRNTELICEFLGVNKSVVYNAIANLKSQDLLAVDIYNSELKLTDKGREAIQKASLIIPEEIIYPVYLDGMTNKLFLDTKRFYSRKDVKNIGITPLSANIESPKLIDINFEELNSALKKFKKNICYTNNNTLEGDLISINDLKKVYAEYKKLFVLVYINEKSENIELRIFEKSTRCQEYETIILRMYNDNLSLVKFDEKLDFDDMKENTFLQTVPKEIIQEAQEFNQKIVKYDKEISAIRSQIIEYTDNIGPSSEDNDKTVSKTQIIKLLEGKIKKLEKEKNSAHRIINTYDHRPLLLKALKESKNSIVIVSPWIKQSGTNQEIINLIDKAVERKVNVFIGYGISEEEQSDRRIINKLKDIQNKQYGKRLKLISLNNTHEKVLISDDYFMVVTSFNWLSFRGDPNFGFRQETGIYTESKECIKDMKENLAERMKIEIK
ncbi:phospholipase D-like domain-containing protein [Clostridium butyricum]|uniref:phospholipase D-like domain-containing protein n=1 Tax=Clostridium butyricum TaxID=1492 RepID=UPI003467C7C4